MNNCFFSKSILWFSPYIPYDSVSHAGGQDLNHTIKYLNNSGQFEIFLITLCLQQDLPNIDLKKYHIRYLTHSINSSKIIYHLGLLVDYFNSFNILHSSGNLLSPYINFCFQKLIKTYCKNNPIPNIIILHWTQSGLLFHQLKKFFPTSKFVLIEVDVAYLGYKRHYLNTENKLNKFIWKKRYLNLRKQELNIIKNSDLTVVLNSKDANLLQKDGISQEKIFISIPFYHNYTIVNRKENNTNIIFFGYMAREENHLSALWFIQNVMPFLNDTIHFTIIGSKPKSELIQLSNDRIHVLGYVEDVTPYFEHSLCMVAPLVLGAGIKIKVLEGMSSGIPVLTNEIGIEGIPAVDKQDFFYCSTPEEYVNVINGLFTKTIETDISLNAKTFINNNFNTDLKIDDLIAQLLVL